MLVKGYKCGFRFPEKGVWTGKSRRIPLANRMNVLKYKKYRCMITQENF